MRFFADGPDIPDELLQLRDEGRVVYFCGAGISMGNAGLPNFGGLAWKVLQSLRSRDGSEERRLLEAMNKLAADGLGNVISADRIFSIAEKTYGREQVASKVSEALQPPANADLSAHRTILKLSTQQSGGIRLITTNFDRLFESCNNKLPSLTRSTLPRVALGNDDWGIVHLHGRVAENLAAPDTEGFVLSSGDFGDAYLANGWARDFVHEILENYAAVFIGYTADDPPIRYLLEGLRRSEDGKNRLFAFQDGPQDEAIANWDEKGVTAIGYDVDSGDVTHTRLYATLDAWAVRAQNSIKWRSRVFRLCQHGPRHLSPHHRGMLAHIVKTTHGALAFRRHEPPISPEWLCVLDPRVRFSEAGKIKGWNEPSQVVDPFVLYGLDSDSIPATSNDEFSPKREVPSDAWDAFALNRQDRLVLAERHTSSLRDRYSWHLPSLCPRVSALGDWISIWAHHPATIWWAAQQPALHPEIKDSVRWSLSRKNGRIRKVI
ncbi:SIR2 family protein, partial [bacterium AH-315-P15]|nr:SIR2 family protein [bacterium AH-315-P15]